jgi:predicted alpha/beta hydrolase family esterase
MKKQVFLVHGWGGSPEDEMWFPWLKTELEKKGFEVFIPRLPDSDNPRIENWIPALKKAAQNPDENTFFVGHSMGCQTILRYTESLPTGSKIGGAVFVAGFTKRLTGLQSEEEEKIAESWLSAPLDLKKIKSIINKSVAIFSDDDQFVPLENTEAFEKFLCAKIIIEKNKSHFDKEAGITELPSALESLLEISRE